MARQCPILKIEAAPGDAPLAVEQLNGDLLLPANARPVLEQALLMAEDALPESNSAELAALVHARRLLGIEKVDTAKETLLSNLLKIRAI
jgi:hypothetical protein